MREGVALVGGVEAELFAHVRDAEPEHRAVGVGEVGCDLVELEDRPVVEPARAQGLEVRGTMSAGVSVSLRA